MAAKAGPPPPSWFTLDQFIEIHAAFAFSAHFGLLLDCKITFAWSLIAPHLASNIQAAHRRFQQCLNDWLRKRGHPLAYVFVTEDSGRVGLHTHWAVSIPPDSRAAFRQWVRRWLKREGGEDVQRNAVKVQTRRDPNVLVHWLNFSYLAKGSSPHELAVSAANSPDGHSTYLADLIAWPCKSPGYVPFRRYGISHNVGPAQRKLGAPRGVDSETLDRLFPSTQRPYACIPRRLPPFRTPMNDGIFDVRRNYPREFLSFVRRGSAVIEPKLDDFVLLHIVELDVRKFLRELTPMVGVLAEHCRSEVSVALAEVVCALFVLRYAGVGRVKAHDARAERLAEHALQYAVFAAADVISGARTRINSLPLVDSGFAACRSASLQVLEECRIQLDSLALRLGFKARPVERDAVTSLLRQ